MNGTAIALMLMCVLILVVFWVVAYRWGASNKRTPTNGDRAEGSAAVVGGGACGDGGGGGADGGC